MKCVEAYWEKRNLGCNTIEIELEKSDDKRNFMKEIEKLRHHHKADYVVVKADTNFVSASKILQESGFWLIETQISTRSNKKDAARVVEQYAPLYEGVTYEKVLSKDDISFVIGEIEKGMFKTDRIAVDPYFGKEISQKRYINWLLDAMEQGAELYLVKNDGERIGFWQQKNISKRKVYVTLLGFFTGEEIHGTGDMIYYALAKFFYKSESIESRGVISANNPVALKLDLNFGSHLHSIKNVFVKHYRSAEND